MKTKINTEMETDIDSKGYMVDYFITIISHVILVITIILVISAVFDKNNAGEASIGSFDAYDYNENWTLSYEGSNSQITLPTILENQKGQMVSLTNVLPENLSDNMSIMMRASMEDMYIYVDGVLREEYSADGIDTLQYYIPSAYVVAKLNKEDSGKEIRVDLSFKSQGFINGVTLGYGNDVWYSVLKNSLPVNLAAIIVLFLGTILSISVAIIGKALNTSNAAMPLGYLMIDIALWVMSESSIRQFVFAKPSLTEFFAYLTVELIGAFACMYFDAVQHRKYHKVYRIAEAVVLVQLIINIILQITHIRYLYDTLIISHLWTAVGIVVVIACIIKDCLDRDIKKYRITAIGMACFLLMSVIELVGFYITRFQVIGTCVCIGLILLMTFTIIQILYDEIASAAEREKNQLQIISNTIETIAGSIDAKDEYTGGHSERVGLYAERLAREIAADYGFSEEDILKIKYIGLVHDIGKIGVADSVLNKAGRLTDEEFSLMKKHTEIGYEIMGATGELMDGILDGIRYHHERFDGKGYPKGLSYTDIPLVARILSLADTYDAMTSNRVYRKRLSDEEVRSEFIRCAGTQFDPSLAEAFVRLIDKGELKVSTDHGMSTDENGVIRVSSRLENRLHSDLLKNREVANPTHVRMMCYMIKLLEKKGKKVTVIFYGPNEESCTSEELLAKSWDEINTCTKEFITGQDMIIRYSRELNVISIVEREEIVTSFVEKMKTIDNGIVILDVDGNILL